MHSVLERLDENLWTVQAPLAPFGIAVGTRATLLRRGDGGMLVISPIPYSAAQPSLDGCLDHHLGRGRPS